MPWQCTWHPGKPSQSRAVLPETKEIPTKMTDKDLGAERRSAGDKNTPLLQKQMAKAGGKKSLFDVSK